MTAFKHKAFTLIEVLIVIVIIGVLTTIIVVDLSNIRSKDNDTRRISDIRQLQMALELHRSNYAIYPETITFGSPLVSPDGQKTYLAKIPQDPKISEIGGNYAGYTYQGFSGVSYAINYTLAKGVGGISAGGCMANSKNICNEPVAPEVVAAWSPDQASPIAMLNFANNSLTNNQTVNSLTLHSGITATKPASIGAPTYLENQINGYPALNFSSSAGIQALEIPYVDDLSLNNTSKTISVVFGLGSNITSMQVIFEIGSPDYGYNLHVYNGRIYSGFWNPVGHRRFTYMTATANTYYLYQLELNKNISRIRTIANGNSFSSDTIFSQGYTSPENPGCLGAACSGTRFMSSFATSTAPYYRNGFNGQIAEFIVQNDLGTSTPDGISYKTYQYLKNKYNIGTDYPQ